MEKAFEKFEQLKKKAELIDESMQVIPYKIDFMGDFSELSKENQEVKGLKSVIKESLKSHDQLSTEYGEVKADMFRIQMKMVTLLQYLEDQDKHKETEKRALQPIDIPGTPKLLLRDGAIQAFSESNTPRMTIDDYAKSPFAKKRTKIALQFSDFEAFISESEFSSVPSYMRGRISSMDLQDFLDNIVIKTFNQKYRIMHLHRSSLKPSEWNLQSMFKSQESYFEGEKFITIGDLSRVLEQAVDKKHDRFLQVLRHLQIIREVRKNSIRAFIWVKK